MPSHVRRAAGGGAGATGLRGRGVGRRQRPGPPRQHCSPAWGPRSLRGPSARTRGAAGLKGPVPSLGKGSVRIRAVLPASGLPPVTCSRSPCSSPTCPELLDFTSGQARSSHGFPVNSALGGWTLFCHRLTQGFGGDSASRPARVQLRRVQGAEWAWARSGDGERSHSSSAAALASPTPLRGQKATDAAAETTASPSPAHGKGIPAAGQRRSPPAHAGDTARHSAASPRHPAPMNAAPPPTCKRGPSARRPGPRGSFGGPRAGHCSRRASEARRACSRVHVCACVWKSLSPRMSGSHVFKIQAHFSEVISGKMLTLITAIKGKYCLSQHKCLFGARLRSTGLFVYVGNSSLGVQRLGSWWAPGGQRAVSESPSLSTSVWWPDLLAPGSRMGSEAFAPRG